MTITAAAWRWCPPGTGARACSRPSNRNSAPAAATCWPRRSMTRHAPITPCPSPRCCASARATRATSAWSRCSAPSCTFEPRRRSDIEFIFAPAQASTERLLRPQLRFHYAGDIPTYATSEAFEPDMRANEDLDGLMFPDMPWILGGDFADAVRAAAREAWPSGGPYRGRLFAFGFDAFRLAQALPHHGVGRQRQPGRAHRASSASMRSGACNASSAGRRCTTASCGIATPGSAVARSAAAVPTAH